MIAYQDFLPQVTQAGGVFKNAQHESFDQMIARINQWITAHCIQVLNIETIVLPNIQLAGHNSTHSTYRTSGHNLATNQWYPVVRVWYSVEASSRNSIDFIPN